MTNFIGTTGDDGLVGSLFSDSIFGDLGNDLLVGLNGDDLLDGGDGKDVIIGGIGDDLMFGGDGADKLVLSAGDDSVFGGAGNDQYFVNGFAGDWSLITDTSGRDTLNFAGGITGARIDLTPGALSTVDGRTIEISGLADTERPLELVLVQDRSGSFSDDLSTISGLLPNLVTATTGLGTDVRLGLASFIDKPVSPHGSAGDHEYQTELGLTSDTDAWSTAVTGMTAFGGNDGPEAQMTALLQVALRTGELGWSADALKVIVLTTDAVPHFAGDNPVAPNNGDTVLDGVIDSGVNDGTGEDYPTITQVKTALLNAGIIPVFAVTSGVVADYQSLVSELGFGSVVSLSSDSSDIVAAFEDGISSAADSLIENAVGTIYADVILGNGAHNELKGHAGNDVIRGYKGADEINGGGGRDRLFGGNGDDDLFGGFAKDRLRGDAGADSFIFDLSKEGQGVDLVLDYLDGTDIIKVLSEPVLSFLDILATQDGLNTVLSYDGADFATLKDVTATDIDATDFVFDLVGDPGIIVTDDTVV